MVRIISLIIISFCTMACYGQIDNLKHEAGYETSPYGRLGKIETVGNGDQPVIMIAGWGFDESIFENFINSEREKYKMYLVTLPGFGNSQAPPMPEANEKYADLYWTKGIIKGVTDLITKEQLDQPIIMSYFTYSNVIALKLALDRPDLVSKVIIVSGMAKFTSNYPSYEPASLAQRTYYIENVLAPQWFRGVDKKTWDNGNFVPATFTLDSIKANEYWNLMSSVPIPVMVRYLCEYYCTDLSLEYANLQIPTLVVVPAFTQETLSRPENSYLAPFFHHSWLGAKPANKNFQLITITDSNAFILDDQPEKLIKLVDQFVNGNLGPFELIR